MTARDPVAVARKGAREHRRERMARLYREGKTVREIGAIVGLSYYGVYVNLQQAGVTFRPRGPREASS